MRDKLIQSGAARWGLLVSLVAVFALISGLCLPGCSENPNSSLETNLSQDETSFFDEPFDEVSFAKKVEDPNVDVEVLFGEELCTVLDGGTLVVGTAGNYHELVIEPDALLADTVIRVEITKVDDRNENVQLVYEFWPDGLVFSTPATLRLNVAKVLGKRATCVDFYYLNENAGLWEFQGTYCADPLTGIADIPVEHFSRWGIE